MAAGFSVDSERHAPHELFLCGQLSAKDAPKLLAQAAGLLETSAVGLVLDLTALTGLTPILVSTINELSASATTQRASMTIRIPEGALADDLVGQVTGHAVQIERTRPLPVAGPTRHRNAPESSREIVAAAAAKAAVAAGKEPEPVTASRPSPGSPRRTGHGHITSYGEARRCQAPGCAAVLSRYNERDVCSSHR